MPDTSPKDADYPHSAKRAGWIEMHLGTRVAIHCESEYDVDLRPAIARAFEEIGAIHRLMSFHEAESELSTLNRDAARGPVRVDWRTIEVLRAALELSRVSSGHFDITVAPELVNNGSLPAPGKAPRPDPEACWRDIEIASDNSVVFHRPLWIDLGGIAKGYAVDRAFQICSEEIGPSCTVNAGGDLRTGDGHTETITLEVPEHAEHLLPQVELTGGALASSGTGVAQPGSNTATAQHINGQTRRSLDSDQFVAVLAERCMIADGLTKVVLSMGNAADRALSAFKATALCHTAIDGWQQRPG